MAENLKKDDDSLKPLQTQIEYYLSDNNLKTDKFFNDLIKSSTSGFIPCDVLLKCNKIKSLTSNISDVVKAISASNEFEINTEKKQFKRKNSVIPELQMLNKKRENPEYNKESKKEEKKTDNVVIFLLKAGKINEIKWKPIKDEIIGKNPGLEIAYLRYNTDSGHLGITKPTVDLLKETKFLVENVEFNVSRCLGDDLIDFWKNHGNHLEMCLGKDSHKSKNNREREREKDSKFKKPDTKSNFKLTKPVTLGFQKYIDIKDIRARARNILNNLNEGDKPANQDNQFLLDLLKHHPNKAKGENLSHITVGSNPEHLDSKCFILVKKDNTKEDFSTNKCLDVIAGITK